MSRIISIEYGANKLSGVVLVDGELFDYKSLECKSNTVNKISVILQKLIKGYNISKEDEIVVDTNGFGMALFDVLKELGLNVTPSDYKVIKSNLPCYWRELDKLIEGNLELQEIKDRFRMVETERKGEFAVALELKDDLDDFVISNLINALVNAVYALKK